MHKGKRLELLLKNYHEGMSINKIADKSNIHRTTLHDIIKRESFDNVSLQKIQLVADSMKMGIDGLLMKLSDNINQIESNKQRLKDIPYYLFCGNKQYDSVYTMRVISESMNKVLPKGCLVVYTPVSSTSELSNQDVVIVDNSGKLEIYKYLIVGDKIIYRPNSKNEDFYDIVISNKQENTIHVIGKVISYNVCLD